MAEVITYERSTTVSAGVSLRSGEGYRYAMTASSWASSTQFGRIEMTRSEALKAHRELGVLLRATAPARKKVRRGVR